MQHELIRNCHVDYLSNFWGYQFSLISVLILLSAILTSTESRKLFLFTCLSEFVNHPKNTQRQNGLRSMVYICSDFFAD